MIKSLWVASCLHFGEPAQDKETLAKYKNWALRNKGNVSIVIAGDGLDNGGFVGTRHCGSVWENSLTPQEQLDSFYEFFKPLAPQMEFVIKGNHESRTESVTSLQLLKIAADRLGVSYKGASSVFVWNNKKIFVAHGANGGLLTDFNKIMNAYEGLDVVVLGHTHALYTQKLRRFLVNAQGNVSEKEIHLVRTGSFLKDAKYAKEALHPPTPIGSAILQYDTETYELNVRLGL